MSKKLIPFYIISVLEELTDENKAMLPTQIMREINKRYGDRTVNKTDTIIENISLINNFYSTSLDGLDLVSSKDDPNNKMRTLYYMAERKFEYTEILFLRDLLLSLNSMPSKVISNICLKLSSFLSEEKQKAIRTNIISDGSTKTPNASVYIICEEIYKAIADRKNIEFNYLEYNIDKKLVPRKRDYSYIVSPYRVVFSRGSYFLIGHHLPTNSTRIYRVDKIKNIKENKTDSYYVDKSLDLSNYIQNSVFMHAEKEKIDVKLRCEYRILDDVIDRFENCRLKKDGTSDQHFIATIPGTTYLGMKYWILEFTSACEVLEPLELRDDIRKTLEKALRWYSR